jgi:3-hydroxyacyl-CoA dehydrogenase
VSEPADSPALRHLAEAERAVADVPGITAADKPRNIGSVGIIGSGTMGGGIAMAFANADIPVILLMWIRPVSTAAWA